MADTSPASPRADSAQPAGAREGNNRKRSRLVYLFIGIVVGIIIAGGFFYWRQTMQTYHLAAVQEGVLYRDGNRGMREFATAIKKVKPRSVVWLIDEKEEADPAKPQFAAEAAYLKDHGIHLEKVRVRLGGWPTSADIQRFLAVVEDPKMQPVIVHCAQGVRRTGMMVAAFQESVLKWPPDKAKNEMLTFGHSDRTVKDVKQFIDVYDPATRTMTKTLEQSVE